MKQKGEVRLSYKKKGVVRLTRKEGLPSYL